ncbi:MAG: hypothetical protein RR307_00725 [Clostridia bacterium]
MFSINIEQNRQCYLEHIKRQMLYAVNTARGTQNIVNCDERSFLEIYVDNEYRDKIEFGLKNNIAEVIALGFKADYLSEKLKFTDDSLLNRTLVNTMSIFDNEIDKKMALNGLNGLEALSLDGYFQFKLKALKNRWDEIINVTNKNGMISYNDYIKIEFLQYLMQSIPTLVNYVRLDMTLYGFVLYDSTNRELNTIPLMKCFPIDKEEELLYNLICLSPKSVCITGDDNCLSEQFVNLFNSLFNDVKPENY